ncbi:SDR family oxidoreductase [uncultured Abyssibacter sp.]|uniref:SDR family oxidoreductase n=1 Tax=uncultured Abyssibacter sp. TaxID=2320202 RepID=UPI0032B1203B
MDDQHSSPPFPDQNLTPPGEEARMDPPPEFQAPDYRPAGKLDNQAALITGGDSGIGRAVATLFAKEGADIAIVYLGEEQNDAETTAKEIEKTGRKALLIPGDVADPEFCKHAVDTTVNAFGKLDVLVNNAAYQRHRDSLDDVSIEQWETTFRTNIFGYFYIVKYAVPVMEPGSTIINTGSVTGLEGKGRLLDYSSTKGAIHAFTKSLAQSLIDQQIRVNCVAPGPVWTPLNPAERSDDDVRDFGKGTPMGRPGQPEEMAPAYVFFASNADSSYITGHVLPLLGGETTAG